MDPYAEYTRRRGLAMASAGLGFLSLLVFWWFPFGVVLSVAGLVLGGLALARARKQPDRPLLLPVVAVVLNALRLLLLLKH